MKIAVGNDHAAVDAKFMVKEYLEAKGHEVINVGTDTNDSCDYPEYAKAVGDKVVAGEAEFGILICGTGIGMSIAANKVKGIRAAHVTCVTEAHLVKEHNNANVICFGARTIGYEVMKEILDAYMGATFMEGNHARRIGKIADMEA